MLFVFIELYYWLVIDFTWFCNRFGNYYNGVSDRWMDQKTDRTTDGWTNKWKTYTLIHLLDHWLLRWSICWSVNTAFAQQEEMIRQTTYFVYTSKAASPYNLGIMFTYKPVCLYLGLNQRKHKRIEVQIKPLDLLFIRQGCTAF